MRKSRKKFKFGTTEKRMITGCVFLTVSTALTIASGEISGMAEWYSTHIYPLIVTTLGRFSGLFPFSLSELCLYVLILLIAGTFVHTIVKAFRSKGNGGAVMLKWASGLFLTASVLVFLYVANCGINYHRISFSEESGIDTVKYSKEELARTCNLLTDEVNKRAGSVYRNESGEMILDGWKVQDAVNAMEKLSKLYPALSGYYPPPKPLLVSQVLSYQGLSGIYLPFMVEANYNKDMSPYNIPFTTCHELSHLRGFMQEEEANFIAFLACKDAKEEASQYSGYLMGWIYSMNALRTADEKAYQEIQSKLDARVRTDLRANNIFWTKYDGLVAEVSNKVNDTYLKANGQTDGVHSYGRMVDLIVSFYKG